MAKGDTLTSYCYRVKNAVRRITYAEQELNTHITALISSCVMYFG